MEIRRNIWYELIDAKFGEIYLDKYVSFNQNLIKSFAVITLLLSISGILSWKFFENYIWLVFVLIAILQLLSLIENSIIRSNKEIEEIINLKNEYAKYHLKLEKVWYAINNNSITEDVASTQFYKLKEKEKTRIDKLDSRLNIKIYKRLKRKTDTETKNYIKKFYYE